MVGWCGLVLGVLGLTLVADLGHVAGVTVDVVSHGLATTIGKIDGVRPLSVVQITVLLVSEVVGCVIILSRPLEPILGGFSLLGGSDPLKLA